jgi:uncharacterized Zn-finger protein
LKQFLNIHQDQEDIIQDFCAKGEDLRESPEDETIIEELSEEFADESDSEVIYAFEHDDKEEIEMIDDEENEEYLQSPQKLITVPRNEEVMFDEVKPQLVLTANFLKAREALKKSPNATSINFTQDCDLENPFKCSNSNCQAIFASEAELKLHYSDHQRLEKQPKQCNFCSMSFVTQHNFDKHVESMHSGMQFVCQICGKILETRIQWRSHLRNHDHTLKYRCKFEGCGKAFRVKHHLSNHLRTHTKDSPFACDFEGCLAKFRQKHALTIHQRKHTGDFFVCSQCKSPFVTQFQLNKHSEKCDGTFKPFITRTKHTEEEADAFKCSVFGCSEKFRAKITLEKHLRNMHEIDVTPNMCIHCCQEFETQQALKSHLRNHLPFTCHLCSSNFKSETVLKKHAAKNHDKDEIRHHKCSYCTASFKRAEHLRTHVAFKHKDDQSYSCDSCSYTSSNRRELSMHIKSHGQTEEEFICHLCDFAAKKLSALKNHMKVCHENIEKSMCEI